jgi:hypothetical protein
MQPTRQGKAPPQIRDQFPHQEGSCKAEEGRAAATGVYSCESCPCLRKRGANYLEGDAFRNGKVIQLRTLERLARWLLSLWDLCHRAVVGSRVRQSLCGHQKDSASLYSLARQRANATKGGAERKEDKTIRGTAGKHSRSNGRAALRLPLESGLNQSKGTNVRPIGGWWMPGRQGWGRGRSRQR